MTDEAVEDERDIELSSISAIFPELIINPNDPHSASLDIEVFPKDTFTINFKPQPSYSLSQPSTANPPSPRSDNENSAESSQIPGNVVDLDTRQLTYLPSLHLELCLPEGYPENAPPQFTVTVQPSWLPLSVLQRLNHRGHEIWQKSGQSEVVWLYIDELQQEAENAFGLPSGSMVLSHELKTPMCSFDTQVKRRKFEEGTFDCGVCLEPKKGFACYCMRNCGHVFCTNCLQDFYNQAIAEGDVTNVKCLAPDCGSLPDGSQKKQRPLHPSELLDIPLDRSVVQRYLEMKVKKIFEADTTTLYCPRKWCQAPARNPKYEKYRNVSIEDFPDDDIEEVGPAENSTSEAQAPKETSKQIDDSDRLAICTKCAYAFCKQCLRSWHGDLVRCLPPDLKKLTEEELASYNYIRKYTSPCPTCNAPVQKSYGCNHMTCRTCNTHFCYLCGSWLDGQNPYKHFNTGGTECYQRLFELEEGDDGQDGGAMFAGARAAEMELDDTGFDELRMRFADEIQERMQLMNIA